MGELGSKSGLFGIEVVVADGCSMQLISFEDFLASIRSSFYRTLAMYACVVVNGERDWLDWSRRPFSRMNQDRNALKVPS